MNMEAPAKPTAQQAIQIAADLFKAATERLLSFQETKTLQSFFVFGWKNLLDGYVIHATIDAGRIQEGGNTPGDILAMREHNAALLDKVKTVLLNDERRGDGAPVIVGTKLNAPLGKNLYLQKNLSAALATQADVGQLVA